MVSQIDLEAYRAARIGLCAGFIVLTLLLNLPLIFKVWGERKWFYRPKGLIVIACSISDIASVFTLGVWAVHYLNHRTDLKVEVSCELIVFAEILASFITPLVFSLGLILISCELMIRRNIFGDEKRLVSPLGLVLAALPLIVGGVVGAWLPYSGVVWERYCGLDKSTYNLSLYVCGIGPAAFALVFCLLVNIFPPSTSETIRFGRNRSKSFDLIHDSLINNNVKILQDKGRHSEPKSSKKVDENGKQFQPHRMEEKEQTGDNTADQIQNVSELKNSKNVVGDKDDSMGVTERDCLHVTSGSIGGNDIAQTDDVDLEFTKEVPTLQKRLHQTDKSADDNSRLSNPKLIFTDDNSQEMTNTRFGQLKSPGANSTTDFIYHRDTGPFSSPILVLLFLSVVNAILTIPWDIYFLTFDFRGTSLTPVGSLVLREVLLWLYMARPVLTPLVWFCLGGFRQRSDEADKCSTSSWQVDSKSRDRKTKNNYVLGGSITSTSL